MLDLADAIRRAWPVLREAIRARRTVTYTELAGRAGPPLNRRSLHRQLLIPLSVRCRRAGLPDLTALVVRKGSGLPGSGWWSGHPPSADPMGTWAGALAACFVYPWAAAPDPRLLEPVECRELAENAPNQDSRPEPVGKDLRTKVGRGRGKQVRSRGRARTGARRGWPSAPGHGSDGPGHAGCGPEIEGKPA